MKMDIIDKKIEDRISRFEFIETSIKFSSVLLLTGTSIANYSCSSSGEPRIVKEVRLNSLKEALEVLKPFESNPEYDLGGTWSLNEVFEHCAQSIEYSLTGFPENKSIIFRSTIGKIAKSIFIGQGYMSHNLNDPIPGAPGLTKSKDYQPGLKRLLEAIQKFYKFSGTLKIHFAYGSASKEEYDKLQAMHIANHLSAVKIQG